jgi:hypothetical protein
MEVVECHYSMEYSTNNHTIFSQAITRSDQLLAFYVMDIASAIPGLPGLFMAGIFSASLR